MGVQVAELPDHVCISRAIVCGTFCSQTDLHHTPAACCSGSTDSSMKVLSYQPLHLISKLLQASKPSNCNRGNESYSQTAHAAYLAGRSRQRLTRAHVACAVYAVSQGPSPTAMRQAAVSTDDASAPRSTTRITVFKCAWPATGPKLMLLLARRYFCRMQHACPATQKAGAETMASPCGCCRRQQPGQYAGVQPSPTHCQGSQQRLAWSSLVEEKLSLVRGCVSLEWG